jgi:hypothetical protein
MHKWWHGEQQMQQLTKEWGHCNQTHLLVISLLLRVDIEAPIAEPLKY